MLTKENVYFHFLLYILGSVYRFEFIVSRHDSSYYDAFQLYTDWEWELKIAQLFSTNMPHVVKMWLFPYWIIQNIQQFSLIISPVYLKAEAKEERAQNSGEFFLFNCYFFHDINAQYDIFFSRFKRRRANLCKEQLKMKSEKQNSFEKWIKIVFASWILTSYLLVHSTYHHFVTNCLLFETVESKHVSLYHSSIACLGTFIWLKNPIPISMLNAKRQNLEMKNLFLTILLAFSMDVKLSLSILYETVFNFKFSLQLIVKNINLLLFCVVYILVFASFVCIATILNNFEHLLGKMMTNKPTPLENNK